MHLRVFRSIPQQETAANQQFSLDEKSDLRMPQTQFKHLEPPKFIRVSIHLQLIRENLPCICTYEYIMV